jgi:hypothetical protein
VQEFGIPKFGISWLSHKDFKLKSIRNSFGLLGSGLTKRFDA